MGIELGFGMAFGVFFICIGYIVRTKKDFSLLAGFKVMWEPINKERLGNRIGILLILIGAIAILTSIFTIWFGAVAGEISGIFVIIVVILIMIAIGLDQMGY